MPTHSAAAPPLADRQQHLTLLSTDFGTGLHFLHTWQQWRCNPTAPRNLTYVALAGAATPAEALTREALRQHLLDVECSDDLPDDQRFNGRESELVAELLGAWPAPSRNVHLLEFEGGRVRLLAVMGPARQTLRQLRLQADAAWVPGTMAEPNSVEARPLAAALARLLKIGASIGFEDTSPSWLEALQAEGFQRTSTATDSASSDGQHAVYRPHYVPRCMPVGFARSTGVVDDTSAAVIIGGGLAGALTARALARAGWRCTVLDRHAEPAAEASGNPAGLFHGSAHHGDGLHARFSRACALLATRLYGKWIESGLVEGAVTGVLRTHAGAKVPQGLPQTFVQSLTRADAQALSACALDADAWLYPGGGWISPGDVCRAALLTPGVTSVGSTHVSHLERAGALWRVLDAKGRAVAEAPVIVCATGCAPLLLPGAASMAITAVRGQISWLEAAPGSAVPRTPALPMTGRGYALRLPDGDLYFGASSGDGDLDAELRASDHDFNRERLAALCGIQLSSNLPLRGRVGWRATLPDRLPLVGPWPVLAEERPAGSAWDQCRHVPRTPGLYALLGLASRGLTWAPMAAEVLAAAITGRPQPLEADLLDAIDPARFAVRAVRKASGQIA